MVDSWRSAALRRGRGASTGVLLLLVRVRRRQAWPMLVVVLRTTRPPPAALHPLVVVASSRRRKWHLRWRLHLVRLLHRMRRLQVMWNIVRTGTRGRPKRLSKSTKELGTRCDTSRNSRDGHKGSRATRNRLKNAVVSSLFAVHTFAIGCSLVAAAADLARVTFCQFHVGAHLKKPLLTTPTYLAFPAVPASNRSSLPGRAGLLSIRYVAVVERSHYGPGRCLMVGVDRSITTILRVTALTWRWWRSRVIGVPWLGLRGSMTALEMPGVLRLWWSPAVDCMHWREVVSLPGWRRSIVALGGR